MRLVLFILALLFVGITAALVAFENPGYVLISRAPWSIEMSLVLFVPLMVAAFFVVLGALYGLLRLMRIPSDVTRWRMRRQRRQARAALANGVIKLIEGDLAAAETELLSGLRHGEQPLLNNLAAAYSAQEQGLIEKRDEYLASAQRSAPQYADAVSMMQARLQLIAHQHEQALATLAELRQTQPRNRRLLRMLAQVYQELRDWTGLIELVPELRSQAALPAEEIDALELLGHRELLQLTLPSGSREILTRAWGAVPRPLRRNASLLAVYVQQLIQQNEMVEAESTLRAALDDEWDGELANLYGQVVGEHPAEQLGHAEVWLGLHHDDAGLYLACGRLALRANDTAKARAYLEKSIALGGPVDASRELGALLERLGEKEKATSVYRRGVEAQTTARPDTRRSPTTPARYRLAR